MKVLIACESSGTVRDSFLKLGHDAISCDLLPTEAPGPHLQQDVIPLLSRKWDLVIAFPPCTDLAVSGARWFKEKRESGEQQKSINFFLAFTRLSCPFCIENPIGIMSSIYRKPDQIIQPWMFGHPESKATCLWLSGLPPLKPTNMLPMQKQWENQTPSGQNKLGPSPDRWKLRSKTYAGVAAAMASQWSAYLSSK